MPTVSSFVQAQVEVLGKNNKTIAGEIHDRLTAAGEDVSFKTIEPKLSKLLNGDPEGVEFFFKTSARLSALAAVIGSDVEHLRGLADRTTLVLDPKLDPEIVAYLQRRSEEGAPVVCVSVESEPDRELRVALRDEALRHRRAVVVTATARDDEFFRGADVRSTTCERHARGFLLARERDLVSLPQPEPPECWARHEPLVPHPGLTAVLLDARDPRSPGLFCDKAAQLCRDMIYNLGRSNEGIVRAYNRRDTSLLDSAACRALECDQMGRVPTYRLQEVWPYLESTQSCPPLMIPGSRRGWDQWAPEGIAFACIEKEHEEPASMLGDLVFRRLRGERAVPTIVWVFERRLFAIGEVPELFRSTLGPTHVIEHPDGLPDLLARVPRMNPWRGGSLSGDLPMSSAWTALHKKVSEEYGLDLAGVVRSLRGREDPEPAWSSTSFRPSPAPAWECREMVGETLFATRKQLTTLSARKFGGAFETGAIIFRLARASRVPLVAITEHERDDFHVIADVGGGHLLRIRARRYDEDPTLVAVSMDSHGRAVLDGGDVRLWMESGFDQVLEGPENRPRRRREAARAAAENDDDD